jgi:hypothetical protein
MNSRFWSIFLSQDPLIKERSDERKEAYSGCMLEQLYIGRSNHGDEDYCCDGQYWLESAYFANVVVLRCNVKFFRG